MRRFVPNHVSVGTGTAGGVDRSTSLVSGTLIAAVAVGLLYLTLTINKGSRK